jgi:hypothetical protein
VALAPAKRALAALPHPEAQGQSEPSYGDASGCALAPTRPSAWQAPQSVSALPARKAGRITGRGLRQRHNELQPFLCEDAIHTGVVLACFDAFCHTITQKTVVVRDHASSHTSEALEDRLPYWKKQGVLLQYLPPDSPELNLLASLWRRIQSTWLPVSAYVCLNAWSEALEAILSGVGSEYQITFA